MAAPDLLGKLLAICAAFEDRSIPYAVGGAVALTVYAEPRATNDLAFNVFLRSEQADAVLAALGSLGVDTHIDLEMVRSGDWGRLWWDDTPIDLFFAYSELHFQSMRRTRQLVLRGRQVAVLGPEDLIAHKVIFNRPLDWDDIDKALAHDPGLDLSITAAWINALHDPRTARKRLVRLNQLALERGLFQRLCRRGSGGAGGAHEKMF